MDYVETIKRGFAHTWNNKFMWVLGFLAALGSGSTVGSNSNTSFDQNNMEAMADWMTPERAAALTGGIIAFACVALILGIILWVIAVSARGGLIGAVAQMELGTGKPTFREAFRMGWKKVVRLAVMTILIFIIPTILFIGLAVAFIVPVAGLAFASGGGEDMSALGTALGGVGLIALCLLCLLIPFTIILGFIHPFAFRGIVLRDLGVMASIRHGWKTLKENLGEILVLGVAFFLVNILIGLVALAVLVPIGLVVGVPFVALMNTDATLLQGILAVLGILIGAIVIALISAITTAWQSSTFTVAYLKWTGKDVNPVKGSE